MARMSSIIAAAWDLCTKICYLVFYSIRTLYSLIFTEKLRIVLCMYIVL